MRFAPSDLDASTKACDNLAGHVNNKWLAANPIPSDRSSWGPFDALAERSLDVRHQIAEHLASEKRSEEHTSELQSLMRISYAVFCLKKKKNTLNNTQKQTTLIK